MQPRALIALGLVLSCFLQGSSCCTVGDTGKVDHVPFGMKERFDALKSGAVDVLARNTTWTVERETKIPSRFVGVNCMDGHGFMLNRALGVNLVFTMSQAAICALTGTTT